MISGSIHERFEKKEFSSYMTLIKKKLPHNIYNIILTYLSKLSDENIYDQFSN